MKGLYLEALQRDTGSNGDNHMAGLDVPLNFPQHGTNVLRLYRNEDYIAVVYNRAVGVHRVRTKRLKDSSALFHDIGGENILRLDDTLVDETSSQCFGHLASSNEADARV